MRLGFKHHNYNASNSIELAESHPGKVELRTWLCKQRQIHFHITIPNMWKCILNKQKIVQFFLGTFMTAKHLQQKHPRGSCARKQSFSFQSNRIRIATQIHCYLDPLTLSYIANQIHCKLDTLLLSWTSLSPAPGPLCLNRDPLHTYMSLSVEWTFPAVCFTILPSSLA